jgi:hypothetical protein
LLTGAALGGEAVILFERYEQKDKSGTARPGPSPGNAQIKKRNIRPLLSHSEGVRFQEIKNLQIIFSHIQTLSDNILYFRNLKY